MKSKRKRNRNRGGKKMRSIVIKLTAEENQILLKQAKDFNDMNSSDYARFMFRTVLYELECTALEQEAAHGVRFPDPDDCTCCKGKSH